VTFTPSYTPSAGQTFGITVTGPVEEVRTVSLPMGIQYDVSINGIPPGYRVKSMSESTSPVLSPNSPAGFAGVYKALSNTSLMITLTRSD
jgi:hypothetical protein